MELYTIQATQWPVFLRSQYFFGAEASTTPVNHVRWTQTPESHLYTAELPGSPSISINVHETLDTYLCGFRFFSLLALFFVGLSKEEIKVEIEDSLYVLIRTEWVDDEEGGDEMRSRKRFVRKFRLPRLVEVEDISARYAEGVLTVTVPRSIVRGRPRINDGDVPVERNSVAPAA